MCKRVFPVFVTITTVTIALLSANITEFWKVLYFSKMMLPNMKVADFGITNRAFMYLERTNEAQRLITIIDQSNLTSTILIGEKGIGASFILEKIAMHYCDLGHPILYAKGKSLPAISRNNPLESFVELLSTNYLRNGNPRIQ